MKCSQHFEMFSQKHQSKEVQASVLQRKAVVKMAAGLGILQERLLLPPSFLTQPRGWSLTLGKRAEDSEAVRLSEVMRSVEIDKSEGAMMVPRLLDPCSPESSQALTFRSDLVLSSSPCPSGLPPQAHQNNFLPRC